MSPSGDGLRPVTVATSPVVYSATLSASSACARQLPAGEDVRVYEVTVFATGDLLWSAPTITQSRDDQKSWLKVDGDTVSLGIGSGWHDEFFGIWENLGASRTLTISGRGSGRVEGSAMSGTFEGEFDSWVTNEPGATCHAADHRFTLTPR